MAPRQEISSGGGYDKSGKFEREQNMGILFSTAPSAVNPVPSIAILGFETHVSVDHQAFPSCADAFAVLAHAAGAILPIGFCKLELVQHKLDQNAILLRAPWLPVSLHHNVGPWRGSLLALVLRVVGVERVIVRAVEPERDDFWSYAQSWGCLRPTAKWWEELG